MVFIVGLCHRINLVVVCFVIRHMRPGGGGGGGCRDIYAAYCGRCLLSVPHNVTVTGPSICYSQLHCLLCKLHVV